MTSEEVILKALASSTNGTIPYADADGSSGVVNAPPRLGRSRIFAKEELMYASNHHPEHLQQQHQFTINPNPGYREPFLRGSGTRNSTSKSFQQERAENSPRRYKAIGTRRFSSKDSDVETENPLQRYENALLRYRKPNQGGLKKDRREPQHSSNNGYSSSDSEYAISKCNKSKSTSSIDTQSVNNILDEYEDLDYGRSSDLSDSGSISVTNFEAVMDQRKRQQMQLLQHQHQQQRHSQVERSNQTGNDEDVGKEREGQLQQHDQRARASGERPEPVFKVNQQTQVRQRSRDRQATSRDAGNKLNSSSDEPTRSRQDTTSTTTSENRTGVENRSKTAPEVLLRKGEVQKRVDEWLNQTQAQHFSALNAKRDSGRIVPLVRSSSSAEPKNSRRSRNDSRSRSTDENGGDRLNSTASYDDINRTEISRNERKLEKTKNVVANTTRGTYKDYLAVRNRARHGSDYGFGGQTSKTVESGASRIPQRGQFSSNLNSRKQGVDGHPEVSNSTTTPSITSVKQERQLSRNAKITAVESRITGISVKTKLEVMSSNGSTSGAASTTVFANGRAASFKRARSHDRNTNIASGRGTSALVKEDQQSSSCGNSRIRNQLKQQQFVSKGRLTSRDQQHERQAIATSPNKVGESRRLLVACRDSRARDDSIEPACAVSDVSTKQKRVLTNEEEEDSSRQMESVTNCTELAHEPRREVNEGEKDETPEGWMDNSGNSSKQAVPSSFDKPKLPRSRVIGENSNGLVPRRPPAPPRRDHSKRDKMELTLNVDQTTELTCSSFRPAKRMYSAFRQLKDKNSFTGTIGNSVGHSTELSHTKSHHAAPKQVEQIYERSLEPEVIHADDLESILKPVVRASAYGEATESETIKSDENSTLVLVDKDDAKVEDSCRDPNLNETHSTSGSPRTARYPEIGLDQCLQVQRRNPSTRSTNKEVPVEKRDLPTRCWDHEQEIINEPAKTFGTFQIGNISHSDEQRDKTKPCRGYEDIDEAVVVDVIDEPTYHEPDLITKTTTCIGNSYETQSTLRLDRNLTDNMSRDLDNQNSPKATIFDRIESENSQIVHLKSEGLAVTPVSSLNSTENTVDTKLSGVEDNKCKAVVNEVLVKNLRFQQDLPKETPLRLGGPVICPKPFNFNSVLSDDYEKIQAGDCPSKMGDDCKIYVTKEEMERQRMMDLLRRRDYDAVKLINSILWSHHHEKLQQAKRQDAATLCLKYQNTHRRLPNASSSCERQLIKA